MSEAFWKSPTGRKFFESTMPRIADGIERLVKAVERRNELLERQVKAKSQKAEAPPDSLKELTGNFIGGKTSFRGDEFKPASLLGRVYIETILLRWANESSKTIGWESRGELIELVVRLVSLSRKNEEVNEEGVDAEIIRWVQSAALETDGQDYRELQRLVMGLCKDAVAGRLVVMPKDKG
jgi:hypothetical protein